MERGQLVIMTVVVAALALFGLKVWSDRTTESEIESASARAANRLARAGGVRGDSDGSGSAGDSGDIGSRAGRPGGSLRPGGGGGLPGSRSGFGSDSRGGGSGEVVRDGSGRSGGTLGYSGSARAGGDTAGGARYAGSGGSGSEAGHGSPQLHQKSNLVDFLGKQAPTQPDLASPDNNNPEDVAIKIDKPADIDNQGGHSENVQEGEDGDGIRITDGSAIQFPNNVSPDAATFSFNIEPDWNGGDQTDNALLQLRGPNEWSNRMELVKNGEFLRFILTDSTGREADISTRITDWEAGQRHDVKATYGEAPDGTCCRTTLYIDGRNVGSNSYQGPFQPPAGVPLQVGGDYPGSSYGPMNGTIRNLTITNNATHDG